MKIKLAAVILLFIFLSSAVASAAPEISSPSAVLIDASTGLVLFEKNADVKMYPASTTKIMTAILAIENGNMADIATASFNAVNTISYDSSKICLSEGESMSLKDLTYSLIIASANDSANGIAEHLCGDVASFVALMNSRAAELGALNTHFINPHGLHDENHYTTARDLALISRYAMSIPMFAEIAAIRQYTIAPTNKYDKERLLVSTNHLTNPVSSYYLSCATGIKTGYTSKAKSCLASSASMDGVNLISVVLGAESSDGRIMSFADSKTLLNDGFKNFKPQTVVTAGEIISSLPVKNAKNTNTIILEASATKSVILPDGVSVDDLERIEYIRETIKAPIKKGEMMGKMEFWLDDAKLTEVDMLAITDYERLPLAFMVRPLKLVFTSVWVYAAAGVLLALRLIFRPRKRRRRHRIARAGYKLR